MFLYKSKPGNSWSAIFDSCSFSQVVIFIGLWLTSQNVFAQDFSPYKEAANSQEVFIGPESKAYLVAPGLTSEDSYILVSSFQSHKGTRFTPTLLSKGNKLEPLILQIPEELGPGPFWGFLALKGKERIGLRIGRFGPNLIAGEKIKFNVGETAVLELNISQQLAYGEELTFQLKVQDFQNDPNNEIYKPGSAALLLEEGKAILPLDLNPLTVNTKYFVTLESRANDIAFLPRYFQLEVGDRALTGKFKALPKIATSQTDIRFSLEAAQALTGISASTQTASTAEFNPRKDVEISLNGLSLWQLDTANLKEVQSRSLAAGDIKEITIQRSDLPPGKHTFNLELGALNAKETVKTEITFLVKKHAFWAFLALIAGVLLSFVVTKGLKLGFERSALRKRINHIKQQSWLKEDRWGAQPIVRAFIRVVMADRALNYKPRFRWFNKVYLSRLVTAPQILITEIENVEARMEVYGKLNRIAIRWGVAPSSSGGVKGMDYRIVWRASKEIHYLVNKLSQLNNDEKIPTEILTKLDKLEAWSDAGAMLKEYEISQKRDIDKLLPQIDEKRFENKLCKKYCVQLRDQLSKPQKITSIQDLLALEENYILLKLLWEQRKWPARCLKLAEKIEAQHALEVILEEFDLEIWEILSKPGALKIANPAGAGAVIEQYSLTEFKVECIHPEANTFLFKHGIQFEWHIDYQGSKPLTPITRCPSVTQFIPQIPEGTEVKITVKIRWGEREIALEGKEGTVRFTTRPTRRFKDLWPVNGAEVASVLLALGLALLAGFQSDAFTQALEGSWPELLVLLAWGVGADQMKNLIQNLGTLGK